MELLNVGLPFAKSDLGDFCSGSRETFDAVSPNSHESRYDVYNAHKYITEGFRGTMLTFVNTHDNEYIKLWRFRSTAESRTSMSRFLRQKRQIEPLRRPPCATPLHRRVHTPIVPLPHRCPPCR